MIRGPHPDSRAGHLHLLTVAQLTGNSMRREHSKWKLMKRTHRTPCVINQHAARDVCGCGFYHISWTERGPTFTRSTCVCVGAAAVSGVSQSAEGKTEKFLVAALNAVKLLCCSTDERFQLNPHCDSFASTLISSGFK